jgi:signal transduction histidine kinase
LSFATTSATPFPTYAAQIAALLGQQLGLYIHLGRTIGKLRVTEASLADSIIVQNQSYEDLEHQIKSPINAAYLRCRSALTTAGLSSKTVADLYAVRGMVGKARQVARSLAIFVQLAKKVPLKCNLVRLDPGEVYKALVEVSLDHQRLYSRRNISFEISKESLQVLESLNVQADWDLFQQATGNVIDNAFKYSYRNTTIRLLADATSGDMFCLTIQNQGLPITSDEIPRLTKRGERGQTATLTTGEGSGLGLWLADNIMEAHDGKLRILPTDGDGWTVVSLVFPIRR